MKCDGNYKYYQNSDCSVSNKEYCQYGCESGACKSYERKECVNGVAYWYKGDSLYETPENCFVQGKICVEGQCVIDPQCTEHMRTNCYDNDVYWFGDCGNGISDKYMECGEAGCSNGKCATTTCTPSWNCDSWSSCSNGKQTRTCTDTKCNTDSKTETRSCSSKTYSGKFPMILIHGWKNSGTSNTQSMNKLQLKLDSDGYFENKGVIKASDGKSICPSKWDRAISVNFEYYSTGRDKGIETYGTYLKNVIDTVKYCTGSDKVNIIAHSMGGLIGRAYIAQYGSSDVDKLITLATPHYGIREWLKSFEEARDVKDMIPNSPFLMWLNKGDCSSRTKYVSIGAKTWLDDYYVLKTDDLHSSEEYYCRDYFDVMHGLPVQKRDGFVSIESTRLELASLFEVNSCSHSSFAISPKAIYSPSGCPQAYNFITQSLSKLTASTTQTSNTMKDTTETPSSQSPTTNTRYCYKKFLGFLWCMEYRYR